MFQERLIEQRKLKNLSQAELARRIGISRDLLNKYERTTTKPSQEVLALIAKELNVTTDYLLGLTDYYVPTPIPMDHPSDSGQKKETPADKTSSEAAIEYFRLEKGRNPSEDELRQFLAVAKALFSSLPDQVD